jgi:hypothetical protein
VTAPATFKQADVTRLVRGVAAAGVPISKVIVEPGGNIVVLTGANDEADEGGKRNPWDEVLNETPPS